MDLYEELGVASTSSTKDIKKAYRSKAQKFHPDKKDGDSEKFHTITVAYQVLKDKEQRHHYDETGEYKGAEPDDIAEKITVLFLEIVSSGDYKGDLVNRCRKLIDREEAILSAAKTDIETEVNKLKIVLPRISFSGEGKNLFEEAVNAKIKTLSAQLGLVAQKTKELEEIRQTLDSYIDTAPEEVNTPSLLSTTTLSTHFMRAG